jgi:hypothetical protein
VALWPEGSDSDDKPDEAAETEFGGNTEEFAHSGPNTGADGIPQFSSAG